MSETLNNLQAACSIQKVVRAHFAKKRVSRIKHTNHQRAYQLQFETQETLFRFKFQQSGAAIKIQRWYRSSFTKCHKIRWRKKFVKVIEKCISQKKLRKIIRRSRSYVFPKEYLITLEGVVFGSTVVLQRIMRGMLGRRRFSRLKIQKQTELKFISKIQSTMRTTIVRQRFPDVGTRYRMLKKKERDWTRRQSTHENLVITEKQLRTLQAASEAAEAKANHKQHLGLLSSLTHTRVEAVVEAESDHEESSDDEDDDDVFSYTRRASFLFVNMKLGSLEFLESLDGRILKVQCAWYRYKAYRKVKRIRDQIRLRRIIQLQRWFANVLWRRHVRKAARIIQPLWKERVRIIRLKRASATRIQAFWRGFVKHSWWRVLVTKRNFFGLKLKKFIVHKNRIRIIRSKVKRLRSLTELRVAGLYLYQQTEQHWLTHYLWVGIKKTKSYEVLHELQRLFTAYSLNGNMESLKFVKMMKECSGLVVTGNNNLDMSINTMELQFAKIKAMNEKRIDYAKFVDLLYNLAIIKFLKLDPGKVLAPVGGGQDGKDVRGKQTDTAQVAPVISGHHFNGLKGKAALVTRFFMTYIATMAEYPAVVVMLKQKAAKYLGATHIAENLKTLQLFVLNRLAISKLRKDMIRLVEIKRVKRLRDAAQQIQRAIRGFLGKRMIMRCAQTIYTKYIDGESEREYWFNLRTNRSFWTKPTLLGEFDCGMATRMPRPEEQFSIYCKVCEDGTAQCYCLQCNEPQCLVCFATTHKGGQRKLHTNLPIDNCIQCEFQVGTRSCATCKDLFCDSCYKYMHRKGRLRYHVFERTSYCCEVCDDLTAQWKQTKYPTSPQAAVAAEVSASEKLLLLATGAEAPQPQYGQFLTKLYCGRCYFDEYGQYPEPSEPELVKVQFYGKTINAYRNQQAEDLRKKDIADKFARRNEELRLKKLNASVATIQRVARGFMKRREISDFLQQRRVFMALRHSEEKERHSLYYYMMTLLGFSPKLLSDTPLERVMKLYPRYMHHILSECVDNKWNEACRLLVEHEESLRRNPPSTLLQRASAKLSVALTKRGLIAAEKTLEEKSHAYENLEQRYQQAESTGVLAPSKMKKLQNTLNKAAAGMNKAIEKKEKQEKKCSAARSRLTDCIGPRGLQSLIEDRRRHGLSMPFRVTIRKNSRLALVGWENSEYVAPEENEELFGGFDGDEEQLQSREELFKAPQYNFQPGRWKERLKLGDTVFVEGVKCRIVRPPPRIAVKKLTKFKPATEDSSMADQSDSQSNSKSTKKKRSGTGDNSASAAEMSGMFDDALLGEGASHNGMEVELKEEYTEDHIQLDRPWLLDDCYNVEIFKLVHVVFYYQPFTLCRRLMLKSYPAQKIIAVAAIMQFKLSRLYERIGNLFDEESSSYSYWHNQARLKMVHRDDLLKLSYSIVQMSFDFTLRRRIVKALYSIFSVFKMMFKMGRAVYKLVDAGAKETPFEGYQRSLNKEDISVVLDLEGNTVTTLGEFKMDITAPVEIMREYIRRNFAAQLNETVGDSFLFYRIDPVGGVKGQRLKKEDEFKTYSKDYALLRTDATTMMSAMTATLVRDPDRGRVMIEVIAAPEEEENDEELLKMLKH